MENHLPSLKADHVMHSKVMHVSSFQITAS